MRRNLNKVFPDHWSFLIGEIALYSFIVLLLTGIYLTLFFDPCNVEIIYDGSYVPLKGVEMSRAYASTLEISFDVRAGLVFRQIHHWAALVFVASIVVHLLRVFFTGAYRKPREVNWLIGVGLLTLGMVEGFAGYSLPDDLLSGTGLRIAASIAQSIPIIGTWASFLLFNGEFPGEDFIPRLYVVHILLVPGILLALIGAHLGILWHQKHTDFPGPGKTEDNVVGHRVFPVFAVKSGGFFMLIFAVLALLGGLAQINPIWTFGPYDPAKVSAASQPDWYIGFLDGSTRLMPPWEFRGLGHTVPALVWPTLILPGVLFTLLALYPFLEAKFTGDKKSHNLLQRPREAPTRTALGAMAVSFYLVLWISGGNDIIAHTFSISLNAMTWAGRIGLHRHSADRVQGHEDDLHRAEQAGRRDRVARRRDRHHPPAPVAASSSRTTGRSRRRCSDYPMVPTRPAGAAEPGRQRQRARDGAGPAGRQGRHRVLRRGEEGARRARHRPAVGNQAPRHTARHATRHGTARTEGGPTKTRWGRPGLSRRTTLLANSPQLCRATAPKRRSGGPGRHGDSCRS